MERPSKPSGRARLAETIDMSPDRATPRTRLAGTPEARDAMLERLAAIVECSGDAMMACDAQGRIETANAATAHILGLDAGELVGRDLVSLLPPANRGVLETLFREAARGQASEIFRALGTHADGHFVDLSVTLAPMRDPSGAVTGVCVVARDISARCKAEDEVRRSQVELADREAALRGALVCLRQSHEQLKATQLQLIQSAKLESVGRLAAGVAHEVKNPLAVILSATEYLLANPGQSAPQVEPLLQEIRASVIRGSAVIGGLLNYATASELHPTTAELNPVVEQALLLVHHALAHGRVRVVKELASGLPALSLDVPKIEQVFINLLINAIDAMPQGGTLTVRTRRTQLTAGDVEVGVRRDDRLRVGQTVIVVEVEDTGTGIAEQNVSKVLDPFFTTKPAGKGTGLGLAVSRTIVAMHGGTLWIRNRTEGGVRATVVLRSIVA